MKKKNGFQCTIVGEQRFHYSICNSIDTGRTATDALSPAWRTNDEYINSLINSSRAFQWLQQEKNTIKPFTHFDIVHQFQMNSENSKTIVLSVHLYFQIIRNWNDGECINITKQLSLRR